MFVPAVCRAALASVPLGSLRDLLRETVDLPLRSHDFHAGSARDQTERALDLDQVGLTLRLQVARDLGHTQRQLALLSPLAVLNQLTHAPEQGFVVARGRDRSDSLGTRGLGTRVERCPQVLLERREIILPGRRRYGSLTRRCGNH